MEKALVIEHAINEILAGNLDCSKEEIVANYPFEVPKKFNRSYSLNKKMEIFLRDGFIDRYSGDKLVNPGILKTLSNYFPHEFPFQAHGKMTECHSAYWEVMPSIDHIVPVAKGGQDIEENWATTSMMHNMVKNLWTLEQLNWKLHSSGDLTKWDGMTDMFIKIIDRDQELLNDSYIKAWYNASIKFYTTK